MFSEIPNLLGKNFVTGFFLPVVIFLGSAAALLTSFGLTNVVVILTQNDVILGATLIGILAWLGGVVLAVVNRTLYRVMEGYGQLNPLRMLRYFQRRQYRKLRQERKKLNSKYREQGEDFSQEDNERLAQISRRLVDFFPDKEEYVLPTSFGNTIRAFEVYPRVMYGFEAITGWERLLAVVSPDYRDLIDAAKTKTDFWLNLQVLSVVLLLVYAALVLLTAQTGLVLIPLGLLVILRIAYLGAKSAALEWGDWIKATFDLYLVDLAQKLGYELPATQEEQRRFWEEYSQATSFRRPEVFTFVRSDKNSRMMKDIEG